MSRKRFDYAKIYRRIGRYLTVRDRLRPANHPFKVVKYVVPHKAIHSDRRSRHSLSYNPFLAIPSSHLDSKKRQKVKCRAHEADKVRRHQFFKARAKGGSSRRPEHNQKHNRSC